MHADVCHPITDQNKQQQQRKVSSSSPSYYLRVLQVVKRALHTS